MHHTAKYSINLWISDSRGCEAGKEVTWFSIPSRECSGVLILSVVMEYLEKEAKAPVTLVGIQPDLTASGEKPTRAEERGIRNLAALPEGLLSGK
jgi:hypothetical protein